MKSNKFWLGPLTMASLTIASAAIAGGTVAAPQQVKPTFSFAAPVASCPATMTLRNTDGVCVETVCAAGRPFVDIRNGTVYCGHRLTCPWDHFVDGTQCHQKQEGLKSDNWMTPACSGKVISLPIVSSTAMALYCTSNVATPSTPCATSAIPAKNNISGCQLTDNTWTAKSTLSCAKGSLVSADSYPNVLVSAVVDKKTCAMSTEVTSISK